MVKSIFVSPTKLTGIEDSGANHLIIVDIGLNEKIWGRFKKLKMDLSISVNAFGPDGCPANPEAKQKLFNKIQKALEFKPKEIWIDHFRFDGHWEAIKRDKIPEIHLDCRWCQGKNRAAVLENTAREIMSLVAGRCLTGYFAVPFKSEDLPELNAILGQKHDLIGKIFDLSSPMLYHQMINKPPIYVSDYVEWLANRTQKPVLPIVQIKSMPDDLEDTITEKEVTTVFKEAIKKPSLGVSFFYWTHALEKNKTGIIKKLFTSVH